MLSDEGNAFAMYYFDFDRGRYMQDYTSALQGNLPSEYHIKYSEENYQKLRTVIDDRYAEWKNREDESESGKDQVQTPTKKWWWPF